MDTDFLRQPITDYRLPFSNREIREPVEQKRGMNRRSCHCEERSDAAISRFPQISPNQPQRTRGDAGDGGQTENRLPTTAPEPQITPISAAWPAAGTTRF